MISYKFTALLLSISLPRIIKGMSLDELECAWRRAINVLIQQIKTEGLSLMFIFCLSVLPVISFPLLISCDAFAVFYV